MKLVLVIVTKVCNPVNSLVGHRFKVDIAQSSSRHDFHCPLCSRTGSPIALMRSQFSPLNKL